jgi:polysaccharide export outer membrane protein
MNKLFITFAIIICIVSSCSSPKKTIYFNTNEKQNENLASLDMNKPDDVIITADDIVAINVSSIDALTQKEIVTVFNEGGVPYSIAAQAGNIGVANGLKGYLVNPDGVIDFPVIGKTKIIGLTPSQAREVLREKLSQYIKSPVVEVRIINFKVTLLGEVARVGPVIAPNHKINILEAIATGGDIPITGRKDNVLIIRKKDGKQEFSRVNLNSKSLFTSPYYNLQKNDIVVVEPNKLKRQQTNEFLLFYLPAISTLIGSVLSIYGIVQLTKK